MNDRPPALEGLRVLELAEGIAGAYAGKLLRDQGAAVVKVEGVDGDPLRRWSAATPDTPVDGTGALFAFLHGGKQSVTDVDDELVRWADVVIGGDGIDVPSTTSVVTIEAFGADGPFAGNRASEFTLQAWCGLMSGCGTVETPPLQMGIGHGQWAAGAVAAMSALAAVRRARRTGWGPTVEVSALEVMAVCLTNYPPLYRQFTGSVSFMSRSGDWPQVVRCKDGWIGLCVFTAQQWSDFAAMIGREDLAADDRLNSMGGRARDPRARGVGGATVARGAHAGGDLRARRAVPRAGGAGGQRPRRALDGPLRGPRGVRRTPGRVRRPRSPFRMSASPVRPVAAAPALGAHDGAARIRHPRPRRRRSGRARADRSTASPWSTSPRSGPVPACTHLLATLGGRRAQGRVAHAARRHALRHRAAADRAGLDGVRPHVPRHQPGEAFGDDRLLRPRRAAELVLRLVEQVDVVVENFTPRVLGNVGLDWHDLFARNPALVMLRMPAFGLDGPWRDHSGFAQTTEQMTGIAWMTGTPVVEPLVRAPSIRSPASTAPSPSSRRSSTADRTGEGQLVEMPMAEVAMNVAAEPIVTWSAYGPRLERAGNRGATGAPQGVYRCAGDDAWVVVSVTTDERVGRARRRARRTGLDHRPDARDRRRPSPGSPRRGRRRPRGLVGRS